MFSIFRPFIRLPTRLRRRARRSRLTLMLTLLLTLIILLSPFYIIYKPPHILVSYFQRRWPDVLWHVPTTQKIVALTIDDAPSEFTEEILRTLESNDASATFFVIGGQVRGREGLLERIVRGGNELGNHGMFDEPARGLGMEMLEGQIEEVEQLIGAAYRAVRGDGTGDGANGVEVKRPLYFRPGSGFFSERMISTVKTLGYRLVLGSVYPHDPQIPFWRVNAAHVLSMVRPGSIIICHDRRGWTVPMLEKVLPELKKRGFRAVTVSQLLAAASRS